MPNFIKCFRDIKESTPNIGGWVTIKTFIISCILDSNWETQELPGIKLDWHRVNNLLCKKS